MIQRIQSLYLLIATLLSSGYFFFPFSVKVFASEEGESVYKLLVHGIQTPDGSLQPNLLLAAFCMLLTVMLVLALGMYSNRKLQIKIGWMAVIPCLAIITADYFLSDSMGKEMGVKNPVYMLASYVPVFQFVLIRLAIKAIQRDEELVRSANRIR
jgi:hypothetical protein